MYPLVLTGKLIGLCNPYKKKYTKIFFFPFYHIGGAEKVHYQILEAVGNESCLIYFTRKSKEAGFIDAFKKTKADIKDISKYTDIKALYFLNIIFRGIISAQINCIKTPVMVFNGQCNFGYKTAPWIKQTAAQFELIHALNSFAYIRLPYLSFYKKSITVSQEIINKYRCIYKQNKVPEQIFNNFIYIESKIKLPEKHQPVKKDTVKFFLLYVGRNTSDKRPYLYIKLAENCSASHNLQFLYAGSMTADTKSKLPANVTYLGEISNEQDLYAAYEKAHAVIIPSQTESGPLVFMEAMAKGCAIIATPVGYMPMHIKKDENGCLTSTAGNEETILKEMQEYIFKLAADRQLLKTIETANINYAFANFGIDIFYNAYKRLLT